MLSAMPNPPQFFTPTLAEVDLLEQTALKRLDEVVGAPRPEPNPKWDNLRKLLDPGESPLEYDDARYLSRVIAEVVGDPSLAYTDEEDSDYAPGTLVVDLDMSADVPSKVITRNKDGVRWRDDTARFSTTGEVESPRAATREEIVAYFAHIRKSIAKRPAARSIEDLLGA
jgi:hypothetical protein